MLLEEPKSYHVTFKVEMSSFPSCLCLYFPQVFHKKDFVIFMYIYT